MNRVNIAGVLVMVLCMMVTACYAGETMCVSGGEAGYLGQSAKSFVSVSNAYQNKTGKSYGSVAIRRSGNGGTVAIRSSGNGGTVAIRSSGNGGTVAIRSFGNGGTVAIRSFGSNHQSITPDQWKAWKVWQGENATYKDVPYATYKAYQTYKDKLSFEEYQQYIKDISG